MSIKARHLRVRYLDNITQQCNTCTLLACSLGVLRVNRNLLGTRADSTGQENTMTGWSACQ
jgi:hypothetical protein